MSASFQPRPLLEDLRALPRSYWVLVGGTFINRFGTFVMPFLIIFLWKQGHTLTEASFAVSAFGVGALCGSAFGGWLADRIGRRNTIAVGAFAAALFYLLLYFARPMPLVVVCAILAGASASIYPPASSALVTDVVPVERRVRAFSAWRTAANAGFACGAATAGFLAKISFFALFLGDAITTTAFGVIALVALPHGLRARRGKSPWPEALRHIRKNRAFLLNFGAVLCASLIFSQFATAYSAQVVSLRLTLRIFGYELSGETIYGLLIGWNGLLVMLAELPLTAITLRCDPRRAMAFGYLLLGAGFALNSVFHAFWTLFAAMTVFTFGEMISASTSNAYIARLSPPHLRGRYMGVLGLAWCFSSVVGPPVGLTLLQHGYQSGWLLCGLLGVIGAGLALASQPGEIYSESDDADPAESFECEALEESSLR